VIAPCVTFVAPVAPKKPSVPVALPSFAATPAPEASVVVPVEVRVVAATGRGVVLPKPRTGGDAKLATEVKPASDNGEMYTLPRVPAFASATVAALTSVGCVVGVPVTPGGYPAWLNGLSNRPMFFLLLK